MQYNTFTKEIHALILQRGREYFRQGAVLNLTETADGWTAEVEGQEPYHVAITGHDQPVEWFCDCPHDHGPVCKHVAAVLYAIRDLKGIDDEEE
jgi:uncharacterized Zn finger protein